MGADNVLTLCSAKGAAEKIPELINALRVESQGIRAKLSEVDKQINQVAHAAETPMNAAKAAVFMAEFSRLRKERRALKQRHLVVQVAITNAEKPLSTFRAEINLQHDRNKGINSLAKLSADRLFAELTQKGET